MHRMAARHGISQAVQKAVPRLSPGWHLRPAPCLGPLTCGRTLPLASTGLHASSLTPLTQPHCQHQNGFPGPEAVGIAAELVGTGATVPSNLRPPQQPRSFPLSPSLLPTSIPHPLPLVPLFSCLCQCQCMCLCLCLCMRLCLCLPACCHLSPSLSGPTASLAPFSIGPPFAPPSLSPYQHMFPPLRVEARPWGSGVGTRSLESPLPPLDQAEHRQRT